jgi:hypothetical protein
MISEMSKREKTLAFFVGGVLFVLLNVVLLRFFLRNHTELRENIAKTQGQIDTLKRRDSERAMWAERDMWLTASMPVIGDDQVATRELGFFIKEVAQKHGVLIETPSPSLPAPGQFFRTLRYKVTAKGTKMPMFEFLRELQQPRNFLVFDPVDIKIDPAEKTQLVADVTVTKWFAP